jgi:TrmH family RNA methyltransferase
MAAIRVVLVEPKYEGNIGFVARAMANFGLGELVLVDAPPIGDEARRRAMAGLPILEGASAAASMAAAVKGCGLVAGTTGIASKNEKRFARLPLGPRDFAERVRAFRGRLALVFGREDYGLFDEEIRQCDLLVTIPASEDNPVLNLSHAAAILFYELHGAPPRRGRIASGMEREKLHDAFSGLLAVTEYPAHKRERTQVMFRRLVGRAIPTKWEFHALMGVFTRATKRVERLERAR